MQRNRRTREQVESLLAEFSKSGLRVKEFCSLHQLSVTTFHKWQARHRKKAAPKDSEPAFARVQIAAWSPGALFAEVKGIRLYQPVEAAYLKELLQ